MSVQACEHEHWTPEHMVYFCRLKEGHEGSHDAYTTCGYSPAEMGDDPYEVNR